MHYLSTYHSGHINTLGKMEASTYFTQKRFASKIKQVLRLMGTDEDFLSLCQDYHTCVKAFQYWSKNSQDNAAQRAAEYSILVKELEKDIKGYIISDATINAKK